jgi:multidrug efflux pump subunit AcrA (membrane-fusion protein)
VIVNRNLILPAISVIALTFMGWHLAKSHQPVPEVPPPVMPARSPYLATIAGAGIIEPRSENILVAAPVPGTVAEVNVKVGSLVEKGDPLFRLDDRSQKAELEVQRANVQLASAQLSRWKSMPRQEDIPPSEARVARADAELQARSDDWTRTRDLVAKKVLPDQDLIQKRLSMEAAEAELALAKAEDARLKAGAWANEIQIATAELTRAEQAAKQAEVEIDRLVVRSPIRGTILKVNVRPGEYVGAQPGLTLIVMGDIEQLHVRVDIDEQDLVRFRPGLPGKGFVRGDAEDPLALDFVRVEPFAEPKKSLTNSGNERVDTRVLQVIYALRGKPEVYVGQQIDVFLDLEPESTESVEPAKAPEVVGLNPQ